LVNPQCDPLGAEARQMAVHAVDLLESAQQVMTLPEALAGCQLAVATTGLDHSALEVKLESPRTVLPWLAASQLTAALIFGREDRGLTKTELSYAQRWIRIPTSPDYGSLNLAQAVAICCYELSQALQLQNQPATLADPKLAVPQNRASLDLLEGYYQQLESFLLQIGYLYPHTAPSRMEKFRLLFGRAQLSEAEVALCRGIITQANWALRQARGLE
jgi:tRNA/rRNA methyltransferase